MYYRINGHVFRDRFEDEPPETGDMVMIMSGPFSSFEGQVREIDEEQSLAVVVIKVFGRDTPVSVDYSELQKLSGEY